MNKVIVILAVLLLVVLLPGSIYAQTVPTLYYSTTCPHCTKAKAFLEQYQQDNPQQVVEYVNVRDDQEQFIAVSRSVGNDQGLVPLFVVGDRHVLGYGSDNTTGAQYLELIEGRQPPSSSPTLPPLDVDQDSPQVVALPIVGEVEINNIPLPILTILLAFFDGFNPCAMWVLLFLISLLLGMKDRFKMWALGLVFILTSGIIYFLFLAAWLQVYTFIGVQAWLITIIGLVAIVSGLLNIRKFFHKPKSGCSTADSNQHRQVFTKLKQITTSKSFILAIVGVILLSVSVNVVELVCSAGLPAIYTGVLSLSQLPTIQYYLYLLLYVTIFILDDLAVFIIAMVTLKATGISTKYSRWSSLIGGILILIIGILLLVKPELVMLAV